MIKKELKYIEKNFKEDLTNKTILITGGNSGIGYEVARIFAYLKANVIIAGRSSSKCEEAKNKLIEEFNNHNISTMNLDLSEKNSIVNFAKKIEEEKIDIDIFYHNAGVYRIPFQIKEEKDIITSTNFFGPMLLTSLVLPYLHSLNHEVKMIITSSIAASTTNIKKIDLYPNEKESKILRYSKCKLLDANLFYYLYENDHKNIKYTMVHPGLSYTGLFEKAYHNKTFIKCARAFTILAGNPAWKSALGTLIAAKDETKAGTFIGPRCLHYFKGYPKINHFLDKRARKNLNFIIEESEKIIDSKLIKD